jgi:hypothetical protein
MDIFSLAVFTFPHINHPILAGIYFGVLTLLKGFGGWKLGF